jgi:predicted nucleic-acid-binding protein
VIAVDTNVLVRIIVEDDAHQVELARAFIAAQDRVFVSRVVLLELGWVLGSRTYKLTRETIASSIRILSRIPNFEIDSEPFSSPSQRYIKGRELGFATQGR